ncbi:MAG TPA: hypothetical protein VG870_00955 [Chitinophagaceae bacterium]|nr:hypothetical protein [Chitinophagaceae bacterium]
MTPEEFNNLGRTIQAEALYELGTRIGEREQQGLRYVLYRIEDFVVEVCFHKVQQIILHIRGLHSMDSMERPGILQAV